MGEVGLAMYYGKVWCLAWRCSVRGGPRSVLLRSVIGVTEYEYRALLRTQYVVVVRHSSEWGPKGCVPLFRPVNWVQRLVGSAGLEDPVECGHAVKRTMIALQLPTVPEMRAMFLRYQWAALRVWPAADMDASKLTYLVMHRPWYSAIEQRRPRDEGDTVGEERG